MKKLSVIVLALFSLSAFAIESKENFEIKAAKDEHNQVFGIQKDNRTPASIEKTSEEKAVYDFSKINEERSNRMIERRQ